MADIFISYEHSDHARAQRVAEALEQHGWSVWWDRKLRAGDHFDKIIQQALDTARCVVVLWSKTSISSRWVKDEASEGAKRGILVPVLIDDIEIPLGFRQLHTARLTNWATSSFSQEFYDILESVEQLLSRSQSSETVGSHQSGNERQPQKTLDIPSEKSGIIERAFAIAWASIIFAFVIFLVLRNQPIDPNYYGWVRILLSFAIAVLGATIPGFLDVEWKGAGLVIRAAGALALFVITFFGTPKVLPSAPPLKDAEVGVLIKPSVVDFRTSEKERLAAPVVLTIPLQYENKAQAAKTAKIEQETAAVHLPSGTLFFSWKYFVNQNPENVDKWLGIVGGASPDTILSGGIVKHETLFENKEKTTWQSFLEQLDGIKHDYLTIVVSSTVTGQEIATICQADMRRYRQQVDNYRSKSSEPIVRITLQCI